MKRKPTELERRVYQAMRDYRTNREIAKELFVSEPTVGLYVSKIYKEHNVRSRIEFLRLFREKIGNEG